MALVLKDRVKVLATTTGTGTFTLGAAVTGFQDFSVIGNGNTTYYTIAAQATPDWEVGIGTYTASGTLLSRDTILESSNGGAAVDFPAGTKDVFVTYPAERATYLDTAGAYPVQNTFNTLNATNAVLTAGTISTTPSAATDIVNKTYVDTAVSSGIHFHQPVRVESPINLNATYNNGTAGVGATLTNAGTQVALVIDGVTVSVADRVLVYEQTTQTQNGIYVVTDVGSGSTNWILTRSSDADTYAVASANGLGEGSAVFVQQGTTGAGETYVCNTAGTITFGTTNITFAQISSAQIYSAGTGLTLSGTQFSLSNTGTAGTYGSASNVPVFTTNAQGQVTAVTDTAIAIAAGAVSGLAASATTDTTNASNITSGTLGTSRLSGSYTGITGVGTLAAGTWNGSTIGATYGGTGLSSFAAGDIIYADSSTTLARLADTAVGNALISGGAAADPSWGKIGLATHVDGTLPIANGGTNGAAVPTAGGVAYGNGSSYVFSAAGTSGQVLTSSGTGAPSWTTPTVGTVTSVSGTGSYGGLTLTGTVTTSGSLTLGGTPTGTWPISVSGNAATATTATNQSGGTVNATTGIFTPNTTGVSTGLRVVNGDITVSRSGGTTGVVYFGTSGSRYLYYDGTNYLMPNGQLDVNGERVLNSGNYNTYAPTKTGGGASGTWGISITGNAATSSNTSSISSAVGSTYTWTATQYFTGNGNTASSAGIGAQAYSTGGNGAIMAFHRSNFYAVNFGLDSDNVMRIGGWSAPANRWQLDMSGNCTVAGNLSGQYIFGTYFNSSAGNSENPTIGQIWTQSTGDNYLRKSTPAHVISQLGLVSNYGTSYYQVNTWMQLNGGYGLYCPSINGAHLYPNTSSSYGEWAVQGSRSGYSGIQSTFSGVNGSMYDSGGNGGAYREASSRWYWYYNVGNDCMGIGTSSTDSSYSLYVSKGLRAFTTIYTQGGVYGQNFYSWNDSSYYVTPAGQSRLNNVLWVATNGSGNWPQQVQHPDRGIYFINSSGSAIPLYFSVNSGSTVSGYILASGATTQYITTSDYRLKENVQDLDKLEALNKIMSVKPRAFNWLEAHGGKADFGFIAHELQEVAPECVAGAKDAMMPDGKIMPQGVDTSFLMPTLCAAIQKQQEMIEQLMAEVALLKGI